MGSVDHPAADPAVVDEDRVRAPDTDPLGDPGRELHGVEAGVALVGPGIREYLAEADVDAFLIAGTLR